MLPRFTEWRKNLNYRKMVNTVQYYDNRSGLINVDLTGRAYRLKLAIQELWTTPHIFADLFLREWIGWAIRSQLPPMVSLARTIKQHEEGLLRMVP
ncbi:transposase [Paenibacillus thiaminolyticus]|uniref:transposase n=1 Tax=Paenibacillus thiaminolyticus TaxID=49283 RepID=UPI003D2D7FE0